MNRKLKYILVILGVVIIIAVLAYAAYKIHRFKREVSILQEKRLMAEHVKIEAMNAKNDTQLQNARVDILAYIPVIESAQASDALAAELRALALRYSLDAVIQDPELTAISETKSIQLQGSTTVPAELREFTFRAIVSGNWNSVVTYMEAMEEYPRILQIQDLSITSLGRSTKGGGLWQAAYTGTIIVRSKGYK